MHINKFIKIIIILTFSSILRAQFASSPVSYRGKGGWSVSASGTYFDMDVDVQTVSTRYLLQSTWGVSSWLDVVGTLGMAKLKSSTGEEGVADFTGKYHLAYGLGLNFYSDPLSQSKVSFWGGVHVLRFPAKGAYTLTTFDESQITTKKFQLNYDWREYKAYLGIMIPYRSLRFYMAGGIWKVQHVDEQKEYRMYGNSKTYVATREGEYRSDFWTGGIVGMEIQLPGKYAIIVEGFGFNEHNYQIMFGLSQTGGFYW